MPNNPGNVVFKLASAFEQTSPAVSLESGKNAALALGILIGGSAQDSGKTPPILLINDSEAKSYKMLNGKNL